MTTQDIYVSHKGGDNVTNTIRGNRASSTRSAEDAAIRLAEKLFGPALNYVTHVDEGNTYSSRWRAHADAPRWAWCYARGPIKFGRVVPPGAIAIASGPKRALRQVVEVVARHAKPPDEGQLLVPGVPEAADREQGLAALAAWLEWCAKGNRKKDSLGVVFVTGIRAASSVMGK